MMYIPTEECCDRHHEGKANNQPRRAAAATTATATAQAAVCAAVHLKLLERLLLVAELLQAFRSRATLGVLLYGWDELPKRTGRC